MDASNHVRHGDFPWSNIPTEALLAELSKRDTAKEKPECGSGQRGSYDTGLHVFALILILALSTLACGFPLISRRFSRGQKQSKIVFLSQHFGTGVLLATAFVHLLPTAFTSLTDPCLPYLFSEGYKPLAGFVAMVFALLVVALESYLTTRGAGHSHNHQIWSGEDDEDNDGSEHCDGADKSGSTVGSRPRSHSQGFGARRQSGHRPSDIALEDMETQGLVAGASPLPESTPTQQANSDKPSYRNNQRRGSDGEEDDEDGESLDLELNMDELDPAQDGTPAHLRSRPLNKHSRSTPSGPAMPHIPNQEEQKRLLLQCVLLEVGILFHSVFIGMALSVATGPTFAVFLIAIGFHQSFEGLALGSRIAAIHFPRSSPQPWFMVLAYGTTTPIGQAIGLIVHNLYDPLSQTGLLMVGFMNAISSGLLLYAGLVQLLAEDFLTEKSYKSLRGRKRIQAFAAVIAGSLLMAGVGALA